MGSNRDDENYGQVSGIQRIGGWCEPMTELTLPLSKRPAMSRRSAASILPDKEIGDSDNVGGTAEYVFAISSHEFSGKTHGTFL